MKGENAEVKEQDRVGPNVQEDVAHLLKKFLVEGNSWADLESFAKEFPRTGNVENMRVPRLDEELFPIIEQRAHNLDSAFQTIQKGVLGVMAAVAPILDLTFARSKKDKELDKLVPDQTRSRRSSCWHRFTMASQKREGSYCNPRSPLFTPELLPRPRRRHKNGCMEEIWRKSPNNVM